MCAQKEQEPCSQCTHNEECLLFSNDLYSQALGQPLGTETAKNSHDHPTLNYNDQDVFR